MLIKRILLYLQEINNSIDMENLENNKNTSINKEIEKTIRLKRLLLGNEKIIAMFLNNIANLILFSGEISIYDKDNSLITSLAANPSQKIILPQNEIQADYIEIDSGFIFKILFQENLLGFIFIQKNENQKEKILLLSSLIKIFLEEIIKLKVERKQLIQETLNNYREINLLYKFSGTISSIVDFDFILKSVLLESKNIINAETYSVYILDKQTNKLEKKASLGSVCSSDSETHPDRVIARLVVRNGNPEIVNDIKQKHKVKNCDCNINSVLGVPLKAKDELYGVIVITSKKENYFKARDEKLIFSLAIQAAIAIDNFYLEKINWENKRQLALRRVKREDQENEYKEFITRTPQFERILNSVPDDPTPYLIYGERGVGKKLLARKIHRESQRRGKPFIQIDCTQLASNVLSSKLLFGTDNPYEHKASEMDFSYFDLAEGGTLFFQNIDRLPKDLGEKLFEYLAPCDENRIKVLKHDVRIVAETSIPLEKKVEKGEFPPHLFEILKKHTKFIPPLRERKKDITKIAEHFIQEYSQTIGKEIKGIDDKGYEILLSYNFLLGNVKELKEIIERACILTESDIITSEYLFLGIQIPSTQFHYNLLNIKPLYNLIKKGIFPRYLIFVSSIAVFLIFYYAFISSTKNGINTGTFLAWSIWWPLFTLSFFFVARLWCSICPINETGMRLRKIKHFNLKVPAFIQNNTHYFTAIGFLLIIWAEEFFHMNLSGFRTGIILGIIVGLATITNILFTRNTWCRYICPLGWFAGTLSLTSIIELRSNPDICANKCKTHDCFKGNSTIEGCPMLLHLQFTNSNLLCKLCMRCVRLCPNNSPKLNLRLPGWDISGNEHLGQKTSLLIIILISAPFAILFHGSKIVDTSLNFNLVYWILPIVIGLIIYTVNLIFYGTDRENKFQHYLDILNFYIPMALAANLALQLKFLPFLSKINITGTIYQASIQNNFFSFSLVNISQAFILLCGLFFSLFLMVVHFHAVKQKTYKFLYYLSHQILMTVYCFLMLKFVLNS